MHFASRLLFACASCAHIVRQPRVRVHATIGLSQLRIEHDMLQKIACIVNSASESALSASRILATQTTIHANATASMLDHASGHPQGAQVHIKIVIHSQLQIPPSCRLMNSWGQDWRERESLTKETLLNVNAIFL